jgi:hypothetical protein
MSRRANVAVGLMIGRLVRSHGVTRIKCASAAEGRGDCAGASVAVIKVRRFSVLTVRLTGGAPPFFDSWRHSD